MDNFMASPITRHSRAGGNPVGLINMPLVSVLAMQGMSKLTGFPLSRE
jgi:hypothetical protein